MDNDPSNPAADDAEEDPCAPKRVVLKKMASLLVRPKVSFVSLVGHAANGMPFSIVKNEDGTAKLLNPSTPMPKAAIPTFGSANATLNRLEFDLNVFKTEADVEAYLKESNITAPRNLLKTETHFIVPGVNEASLEQIEAVKGDKDGVTYFIGKLKANVASITPKSPAAATSTKTLPSATIPNPAANVTKGEEPKARLRGDDGQEEEENVHERVFKSEIAPELTEVVTKMDSYIARQVGTQTLDQTLATGEVEIPGLWQILRGIEVTVQNIISKGSPADFSAKISAAFARGGEITAGLAGIFVSVAKSETNPEAPESLVLDRSAIVKHFSSPAPEAAKAAEGAGVVKKADPTASEEPATPATEDTAPNIAALFKAELAPVLAKLEEVGTTVVEVQKSATTLESRIVQIESVQQVRKSLPDDGEQTLVKSEADKQEEIRKAELLKKKEEERKADEEFARKQSRSKLGLVV